jgi:hypothetical protein
MEVSAILDALLDFLSADPLVRAVQAFLAMLATSLVFLVFYTTRDVILRSKSLLLQLTSILLVSALPVVGFLIYLLIRPERTLKQRELTSTLEELVEVLKKQRVQIRSVPAIGKMAKSPCAELKKKVEEMKRKKEAHALPASA